MFSVYWKKLDIFFNVEVVDGYVVKSFFSKNKLYNGNSELKKELEEYFAGKKVEFNFKAKLDVSDFTLKVLNFVRKIPYGKTVTYSYIASKLSSSPRAVGQALKRNPVPVLIPCHRVVAKNGIGGYSEGVSIKKALLELENTKNVACKDRCK